MGCAAAGGGVCAPLTVAEQAVDLVGFVADGGVCMLTEVLCRIVCRRMRGLREKGSESSSIEIVCLSIIAGKLTAI